MQARWWCAALLLMQTLSWLGVSGRLLRPECAPAADCQFIRQNITYGIKHFYFNVSGHEVKFEHSIGNDVDVELSCNYIAMDNAMLPRFSMIFPVKIVKFRECALPKSESFASAVVALNMTGFSQLILDKFQEPAVITRAHLTGLQRLEKLVLYGNSNTSLAPGALAALSAASALKFLVLRTVRVPAADLARLPSSLQELELWDVGAASMHLDSSFNLKKLNVFDNYYPVVVNVSNAVALRDLNINTPSTVLTEDALPSSLNSLELAGWNETHPVPKTRCAQLEGLVILGTNNDAYPVTLPDEWLSNCGQLTDLEMDSVPISAVLPVRMLANAIRLKTITIRNCNLTALPSGLLDDTLNLITLDLSNNQLTSLPRKIFEHTKLLSILILSNNQLTSEVVGTLSTVTSLVELSLVNNNRIGDLCSHDSVSAGPSPLSSLTRLNDLDLSNTGVSHVCSDWREKLTYLTDLYLRDNPITLYNLADLQFRRIWVDSRVYLGHFKQQFTRTDYELARNNNIEAVVTLSGSLECDCNSYWAAQVFRMKAWRASSSMIYCEKKPVIEVDPDTFTCLEPAKCATLADSCTCRIRDDIQYKQVVVVHCSGLAEFPRLPPTTDKWILHLPHNNISYLAAADVSPNIVELDLRNNSIKNIDVQASAKLAFVRLQLGGNPIECDCEALKLLAPLLKPDSKLLDRKDVKCENDAQITLAMLKLCTKSSNGLMYLLFLLLLLAFVVTGLLARTAIRLRIKMILMRLGWMSRLLEPADDDRPYDAFVSFAHEDEELVMEQLAARLESGSRPYRLCLHYRDWAPGEWIPAQIAASVRASRRTVAVVSAHYLQSGWALAEIREATAASLQEGMPRLIIVLLDETDRLMLDIDPELHAYVRNNTYVRWHDPWFWEKLKQALPPPREQRSPIAPSLPALALSHDSLTLRTYSPRESDPAPAAKPAHTPHETDEPAPGASPCYK
ncbi:protein toll-like [Manduca sexta]|uniref:protein toll-like n=1 Tax=Manduca sexta TaxID=7130 RepID=UPI001183A163|nr:protein toll-like [Manduca sexta]